MTLVKKKSRQARTPKTKSSKSVVDTTDPNKENIITLLNLNATEILLYHYGEGEIEHSDDEIKETAVDFGGDDIYITDLLHEKTKKSKRSIMFLDPHKGSVKYWGIMIDMTTHGPLPRYTSKPCWWCRNKFSSHPIGCPIRYNPHKNTGLDKDRVEEKFIEMNLPLDSGNDFFETEGIFCTFPCVKAYILEQISKTKSPKYKKALTLLTLLYLKLLGVIATIPPAGTWELTIDWGGHMTPQEYRASTGLLEYVETINTRRPYMFCSTKLVREKRVKD